MSTLLLDDFRTIDNKWFRTFTKDGVEYRSNMVQVWGAMLHRTGKNNKYPHYNGTDVAENFKCFDYFSEWYCSQVGFGMKDYQLDKDILMVGNRLYSEESCVLVPRQLNTFLCDRGRDRSEYALGVTLHKQTGKYKAAIRIDGKSRHLGLFLTVELAHQCYRRAKEAEALRWYNRLLSEEFIVDSRVIAAMGNWRLPKQVF